MQIGDPLGEGWTTYKRFWRHLIPIALVVSLVVSLIGLALSAAGGVLAAFAAAIVSIVGVFLLQAALTEAVADVRDGRADHTGAGSR
jgi:1,4-dihydroxy-2-naphthoate octaprenyltransferase